MERIRRMTSPKTGHSLRERNARRRGGATRIRTGESGICSPLPYHLAMAPYIIFIFPWRVLHGNMSGASGQSRTGDTRIFSPLLYLLSYRGKWSGQRDSNSLPPPWQGGALPNELCPHMLHRVPFGVPHRLCKSGAWTE